MFVRCVKLESGGEFGYGRWGNVGWGNRGGGMMVYLYGEMCLYLKVLCVYYMYYFLRMYVGVVLVVELWMFFDNLLKIIREVLINFDNVINIVYEIWVEVYYNVLCY